VQRVVNTLGTPTDDDIAFIGNESAKRYIKNLPKKPKQEFSKL
jgi:mitogen-activated protein kinase 1/3